MKNILKNAHCNLFSTPSDTEFTKFIEEVLNLGRLFPEIYKRIEEDQEAHALEKKSVRLLDSLHAAEKTLEFPGSRLWAPAGAKPECTALNEGRPRMRPETAFLFMSLRGYWGSVSDHMAWELMRDSMTLSIYLSERGVRLPGPTTILENINCISSETREYIHECQLAHILGEGLDDFTYLQVDSTSVKASSSWPTDAGVILKLVQRAHGMGCRLDCFGLDPFEEFYMGTWLKKLKKLLFEINNTRSNKEKKLKTLYRLHLRTAHTALGYLSRALGKSSAQLEKMDIAPGRRRMADRALHNIEDDLLALSAVLFYAEDRVFNGVVLPSAEKVLSISDPSAAFIKKGQRDSVIGYKPQLCRSLKGFVTGLLIEKGNHSDSGCLFPAVVAHAVGTGVIPTFVSTDSGYASGKGRDDCMEFGVDDVCIGGSKGRELLGEELWSSEKYIDGRRMRSAVESLMSTLKNVFEFGRMRRRGLANVRDEMMEKISAYNFVKTLRTKEMRDEILRSPSKAA